MSEILSERDTISAVMKTALDEATHPWGVRVERVEVKDVRLPVQLQRAMAAEAEAAREARAKVSRNGNSKYKLTFSKVIAAEGEHKASSALAQAAHVIEESPHALQVSEYLCLSSYKIYFSASVPPDIEFNFCRTQFNHHLSNAHQHSQHLENRETRRY